LVSNNKASFNLYIVITTSEVILTKIMYQSWHELRNDFVDYLSSVGPITEQEAVDYLDSEYPNLTPAPDEQIQRLKQSGHNEIALTFRNDEHT